MTYVPPAPVAYGMLAEFDSPETVIATAVAAKAEGYHNLDAYSPFPVDGLAESIGFTTNRVPLLVLIGGITGAAVGYFMMWYSTSYHYPINVGGRPFHSWPMFIPITFEMTILFAAFSAVLGMLGLNGLPRPNHPLFAAPGFDRASQDRFFLCVRASDPKYDPEQTRRFFERMHALRVTTVNK